LQLPGDNDSNDDDTALSGEDSFSSAAPTPKTRLFTRLTEISRVIFFVFCARFTVRRETSNFWATFFVFLHRLAAAQEILLSLPYLLFVS
jgi:hypothetical protein